MIILIEILNTQMNTKLILNDTSYLEKISLFFKNIINTIPFFSNFNLYITLINYLAEWNLETGKLPKDINDTLLKYGIYKDHKTSVVYIGYKPFSTYFIDMTNAVLKNTTAYRLSKYWEKMKPYIHKDDIHTFLEFYRNLTKTWNYDMLEVVETLQ